MRVQVAKVCSVSEGQGRIQHPILINSLNINFIFLKSPSSDSYRIILGRGIQMLLGGVALQLGLAGLRNNTLDVDLVIHL